MELAVLNTQGKETGRKVVLSDAVFGVEANDHAIYLDVKQYLADQRQGTHIFHLYTPLIFCVKIH